MTAPQEQVSREVASPDGFEPYEGVDLFNPVVEIVCRDGSRATGCALAFDWEWRVDEPATDIVGYRVIAPRFEATIRADERARVVAKLEWQYASWVKAAEKQGKKVGRLAHGYEHAISSLRTLKDQPLPPPPGASS